MVQRILRRINRSTRRVPKAARRVLFYLRTGSITLTIVIHALHDFLVFVNTSIPEAESTFFLADLLPIIVNVLPFVFGILMLRSRHHAAIIDTWTRIWPEKNATAETGKQ